MADKITNFEDYKKRGNAEDIDIQIEDPCIFFNEQEREEYFLERQKEQQKKASEEEETHEEPAKRSERAEAKAVKEDLAEEYDEEEPEDYDGEEAKDEKGSFPIERFIRISSAITGIVILIFIALVFKAKVYDRFFAKDPDEAVEVVAALPAGYTEKNDTVTVTAKSLNLRTVASSESDSTIVTSVPEGTRLKRIAVSEDEKWALIEYNGTQVYASMKYLSTP